MVIINKLLINKETHCVEYTQDEISQPVYTIRYIMIYELLPETRH